MAGVHVLHQREREAVGGGGRPESGGRWQGRGILDR